MKERERVTFIIRTMAHAMSILGDFRVGTDVSHRVFPNQLVIQHGERQYVATIIESRKPRELKLR